MCLEKFESAHVKYQPENNVIRSFQCKVWCSFYLHEALYELFCFFPFPLLNRKTTLSKKFHISCVHYLLSQRFLYLIMHKLPKVRSNFFEESKRWTPNETALFQKTSAFNKLPWEQKRRVKNFFYCKRIWKTWEKIKFQFSQEPWIYILLKSRNFQIFYIINIMNFNKFVQEIYLLFASLYLIQNRLKFFIHSFISGRLSCLNEWFQIEFYWRKYNEKLHCRI